MRIVKSSEKEIKLFRDREWSRFNRETGMGKISDHFFAAKEKGKIMGYITIRTFLDVCELKGIMVAKKYRRRGIGKKLFEKFEDFCIKKRCKRRLIKTSEKHTSALHLYKKKSYKTHKKLGNLYGDFEWHYLIKHRKTK